MGINEPPESFAAFAGPLPPRIRVRRPVSPGLGQHDEREVGHTNMEQIGLDIGQIDENEQVVEPNGEPDALADDEDVDFITGKRIKLKGNEPVRQAVALALAYEYRIPVEDMERDYPIPLHAVGKRRGTKRADIAIFEHGKPHSLGNLRRIVVCKPQPKLGRNATKLRTFQQAAKDLEELLGTEATPQVRYGMWTNGVDRFFLYKSSSRFGATFEQLPHWPVAEDTDAALSGARPSVGRFRLGEAGALKTAFRRCHNYIHGNEGMPKDAAFWQFLYLLFAKMHDEKVSLRNTTTPKFYALPREHNNEDGRKAFRERVLRLFDAVKKEYDVFSGRDVIMLSDRAIAFIVGELGSYNLLGADADVKGLAYQELVGTNLRGDRGQYFTPRNAVEVMVDIIDPQEHERVLDPCCGTGGFLRETLRHLLDKWRAAEDTAGQARHDRAARPASGATPGL